jgi:FkbM family methyltransferase
VRRLTVSKRVGERRVKLRVGTRDRATWREVTRHGYHRPPEQLQDVEYILDLGSNVGLTVVDFAHQYPAAVIGGVEMDHENYEMSLVNTADISDRVRLHNAAIGPVAGTLLYTKRGRETWGYRAEVEGDTEVTAMTIDNAIEVCMLPRVDYLKMDLEGMEKSVLSEPAGEWPLATRCVYVELHWGYDVSEAQRDLRRLGFEETWGSSKHENAVYALRDADSWRVS